MDSELNIVIGLNISHEPAVVLNIDGRILAAAEEEKMQQIKSYSGFPFLSLQYIVRTIPNVEMVKNLTIAFGCKNIEEFLGGHVSTLRYFGRKANFYYLMLDALNFFFPFIKNRESIKRLLEKLVRGSLKDLGLLANNIRFSYINHHEAHALSASEYLTGNYAVVTVDGKGDGLSATFSINENGALRTVQTLSLFQSLGQLYGVTTESLGFKSKRHEGKVMGLSAAGRSDVFYHFLERECGSFDDFLSRGSIIYQSKWVLKSTRLLYLRLVKVDTFSKFKDFIKFCLFPRDIQVFALGRILLRSKMQRFISENTLSKEDVARGVQLYVEGLVLRFIQNNLSSFAINKLALAGGFFANVRINQEILKLNGLLDIFVQPAMHDAGTALGASFAIAPRKLKIPAPLSETAYLGPSYSISDYKSICSELNVSLSIERIEPRWVARKIQDGSIVGIFSGRLEWGPRALGNRSIIASCGDKKIPNELNRRLNRNDFMPFAPIVMDLDAPEALIGYKSGLMAGELMTCTFQVNPRIRESLSAVVHLDDTVRPQVVSKASNEYLWLILDSIREITGLGAAINTSFNLHEFPIVNSPMDAIEVLKVGAIDYLLFDGFLVNLIDETR